MKDDKQSTALVALVALEDAVQGNEAALAIYNDGTIDHDEKLEIIQGMLNGVDDQMAGVAPKPPVCELGKHGYTFDGEGGSVEEFDAVVVLHFAVNAFFLEEKEKDNPIKIEIPEETNLKPPFCVSIGAIKGSKPAQKVFEKRTGSEVTVFGNCGNHRISGDCHLNKFASALEGNGKACANKWWLLIWRMGDDMPHLLQLPATSMEIFSEYLRSLRKAKKAIHTVWTSFRFKQGESGSNVWGIFDHGPFEDIASDEIGTHRIVNQFRKELREAAYGQATGVSEEPKT